MARDTDDASRLASLDPIAIGLLHDQVFPELYRYAFFRLGDPHLAEDLAAEAFVRLLEAAQAGRGPRSSARGWLFGTLRHMVDDHFRDHYRRSSKADPEPDRTEGSAPAESLEAKEQRMMVRAAFSQLTPDQQDVLALRFGEECSVDETASLMGKNSNAVKALQFRALQALRRALEDEAQ
ncbi:MAG TPA: sigma-70 family RNA polymerase sigma factor [Anaerolineales bacterium]|nr:sigma-70 family RNA polymerase sigma factor [Anaerolineales bacterium]